MPQATCFLSPLPSSLILETMRTAKREKISLSQAGRCGGGKGGRKRREFITAVRGGEDKKALLSSSVSSFPRWDGGKENERDPSSSHFFPLAAEREKERELEKDKWRAIIFPHLSKEFGVKGRSAAELKVFRFNCKACTGMHSIISV